jgi:hypothetical protein
VSGPPTDVSGASIGPGWPLGSGVNAEGGPNTRRATGVQPIARTGGDIILRGCRRQLQWALMTGRVASSMCSLQCEVRGGTVSAGASSQPSGAVRHPAPGYQPAARCALRSACAAGELCDAHVLHRRGLHMLLRRLMHCRTLVAYVHVFEQRISISTVQGMPSHQMGTRVQHAANSWDCQIHRMRVHCFNVRAMCT